MALAALLAKLTGLVTVNCLCVRDRERRTKRPVRKPKKEEPSQNAPATIKPDANYRVIMCLDDSEQTLAIMSRSLELNGYNTMKMHRAEDVISSVDTNPHQFSLYIIDHYLPGDMQGTHLVRQLRHRNITAPIIGISGDDLRAEFYKAGANFVLMKPFLMSKLVGLVKEYEEAAS